MRHYTTSREVAVWLPDDVIGNFHWLNLSGRNRTFSSTQLVTEINTRNISFRG